MTRRPERYELDVNTRRVGFGLGLVGGSPFRLIRLSRAGASTLDAWLVGMPVARTRGTKALRRRLLDAGMIHPVIEPSSEVAQCPEPGPVGRGRGTVGVVVPVLDDAAGVEALLAELRVEFAVGPIVVVDDGSRPDEAAKLTAIARRHGATLVVHPNNRGPAAARNTGWRRLGRDHPGCCIVVFVDADTSIEPGVRGRLIGHWSQPEPAAIVAPRVLGAELAEANGTAAAIAAYEQVCSALDLGADPARVRTGTAVSYVPAATVAVAMDALVELDGFDETMRLGEDVDLVWRADAAGRRVRYDPAAMVGHRPRNTLAAFARQRFGYGRSAADLDRRHPGQVAPLVVDPWSALGWALLVVGPRRGAVIGVGLLAARTALAARGFAAGAGVPATTGLEFAARTRFAHTGWVARAATRAWAPLLMLLGGRSRRALAVAWLVPAMYDWARLRPDEDPVSFALMRAVDHGAYCAGLWSGVIYTANLAPLTPKLQAT